MENKVKYELEFPIHSSPQLLYQYISTPSGLSEWFADDVNSRGEYFTFIWDDAQEKARLASKKEDEITKDVSLVVTDYAVESDMDEAALLWGNQIAELKHIIGSV